MEARGAFVGKVERGVGIEGAIRDQDRRGRDVCKQGLGDRLLEVGDLDGAAVWRRIMSANRRASANGAGRLGALGRLGAAAF